MDSVLNNPSVKRITLLLKEFGVAGEVKILVDTARTAADAASALGVEVGQIASSIVFKLPDGNPLLVITSGAHRVNTEIVAKALNVEKLHRADADYVKGVSGISIGRVSPFGWSPEPDYKNLKLTIIIDVALEAFTEVWAAAGHSHAVFCTNFSELQRHTEALALIVGD